MQFYTLLLLTIIIFVVCEDLKENKDNGCSASEGLVNCTKTENCMYSTEITSDGTNVVCNVTKLDDDHNNYDTLEANTEEPNDDDDDEGVREDDIIRRFQQHCDSGTPNWQRRDNEDKSKALDKCEEYDKLNCRLQFRWQTPEEVASTGGRKTRSSDSFDTVLIISNGEDSSAGQFPHMVLLGYGENVSTTAWYCGGSIISPTFVLTAGHCTSGSGIGNVKYVATGILKRSDLSKESRIYNVKNIIKHPEYHPPHKYHDIALLETETPITLGPLVLIACLNVYNTDQEEEAIATGWGLTKHRGDTANILQYAKLHRFSDEICERKFPPARLLKQGYDNETQMCYGHVEDPKDTCEGDSGGPLQIKPTTDSYYHTIIGVTSFGRQCGFVGEPAIYTRISAYVPWIESVVWP